MSALMLRPECNREGHGFMELRPLDRQTYEQRWCGVWYDCAAVRCGCSVLLPSPALTEMYREAGVR